MLKSRNLVCFQPSRTKFPVDLNLPLTSRSYIPSRSSRTHIWYFWKGVEGVETPSVEELVMRHPVMPNYRNVVFDEHKILHLVKWGWVRVARPCFFHDRRLRAQASGPLRAREYPLYDVHSAVVLSTMSPCRQPPKRWLIYLRNMRKHLFRWFHVSLEYTFPGTFHVIELPTSAADFLLLHI